MGDFGTCISCGCEKSLHNGYCCQNCMKVCYQCGVDVSGLAFCPECDGEID